ncbi:MAG: fasciclin domain-containing protein [bacterium]|nr:fasciclin domain-containing protein [bacterium]
MRVLLLVIVLIGMFGTAFKSSAQDPTIADIVISSTPGEFNTLLAAVQAAPDILGILADPNLNLTVFAPTDEAFEVTLSELDLSADELLSDPTLLTNILQYHIYSGTFDAATLTAAAQRSPRNGATLRSIGLLSDINGPVFFPAPSRVRLVNGELFINRAQVVQADVFASNGVIHVIDRVLLPPQH